LIGTGGGSERPPGLPALMHPRSDPVLQFICTMFSTLTVHVGGMPLHERHTTDVAIYVSLQPNTPPPSRYLDRSESSRSARSGESGRVSFLRVYPPDLYTGNEEMSAVTIFDVAADLTGAIPARPLSCVQAVEETSTGWLIEVYSKGEAAASARVEGWAYCPRYAPYSTSAQSGNLYSSSTDGTDRRQGGEDGGAP
jgi:hypothetical protein